MTVGDPVTLPAAEGLPSTPVPGDETNAAAIFREPEDLAATARETTASQSDLLVTDSLTSDAESAPLYTSPIPTSDMPVPSFHSLTRNPTTPHVEPLQIVVNSDKLICRGVAGNLEPALLSGHVVLTLSEAMNIRDISLEFAGKARIPADPRSSQSSSTNPIIFSHRWSFLPDGAKRMHTIREGRHVFPFQLQLDASLPASMICPHVGTGADVYYKLRATAVRSTFSSNFHAVKPVYLIKAFSPESIEFTQSLEVENTWPGKIMYSFMIPHKAYAAGDVIPALLRFTPTAKGVTVLSIGLELQEATTARWRYQPDVHSVRTVCSTKFEIKQGKPVRVCSPVDAEPSAAVGSMGGAGARSTSFKNLMSLVGHNQGCSSPSSAHGYGGRNGQHQHGPTVTDLSLSPMSSSPPISRTTSSSAIHTPSNGGTIFAAGGSGSRSPVFLLDDPPCATPGSSRRTSQEDVRHSPATAVVDSAPDERASTSDSGLNGGRQPTPNTNVDVPASGDEELTAKVSLRIPVSATPSHSSPVFTSSNDLQYPLPVTVGHKVRFNVLLSNLDGHTSELRCALAVHILDERLLREARAATRITRELLLGRRRRRMGRRRIVISAEQLGDAAPGSSLDRPGENDDISGDGDTGDGIADEDEGLDDEEDEEDEEDAPIELPSYKSHVHDRVANANIDYGSAGNVYARDSLAGASQLATATAGVTASSSVSVPSPEYPSSRRDSRPSSSRGTGAGTQDGGRQLEFDEQLMCSLGAVAAADTASAHQSSSSATRSGGSSGWSGLWSANGRGSRVQSRANSRANSQSNSRAPSPEARGGGDDTNTPDSASNSHAHSSDARSRNPGIFHLPSSLKPFSPLTAFRPGHASSKSAGHPASTSHVIPNTPTSGRRTRSRPPSPTLASTQLRQGSQPHASFNAGAANALSRVPSHGTSSRVYGTGAPLPQFSRDLPTYEQVESARDDLWGTQNSPSTVSADPSSSPASGEVERSRINNTVPSINRSQSEMNLSSLRNWRDFGHV